MENPLVLLEGAKSISIIGEVWLFGKNGRVGGEILKKKFCLYYWYVRSMFSSVWVNFK